MATRLRTLSVRTPRTRPEANRLLQSTAQRELSRRKLEAKRAAELAPHEEAINAINAKYDEHAKRISSALMRGLSALWIWYERNFDAKDSESRVIPLPAGNLGMRTSSNWIIQIDPERSEKVIEALIKIDPDLVTVETKYTLNRPAIAKARGRLAGIKGIRIFRHDNLYIEPNALRDSEETSDRRLSLAVEETTD